MQTQQAGVSLPTTMEGQKPQVSGSVYGTWSPPVNPEHGKPRALTYTEQVEAEHADHAKRKDPHRDCGLCRVALARSFSGTYTRYGNASGVGEVVGM